MIPIKDFIPSFYHHFSIDPGLEAWAITSDMLQLVGELLPGLGDGFHLEGSVAIHRTAKDPG